MFYLENLRLYDKRLKKLYYSKCNEKRKVPGRIFSRTEEYNLSASLKRNLKLRKKQVLKRDDKKIIGKRTNKIGQSRLFANNNKSSFKLKWIVLLKIILKKFILQVKKN